MTSAPASAPRHATESLADLAAKRTNAVITHSAVLRTITRSGTGLTVREIADRLAASHATVRMYANDLRDAGYLGEGVAFGGGKTYFRTDAVDPSK